MNQARTKHTAEAVLRELPSVVGACVREDINGNPREVHLLVRGVSSVRALAHDVRDLLEERLGVAIDQRIISIAQLTEQNAAAPRWTSPDEPASSEPEPRTATAGPTSAPIGRLIYDGLETRAQNARVTVRVRLSWRGTEFTGESVELDGGHGRARAAASATTKAATAACGEAMKLELEGASISRALERDYAVVSVLAMAPRLGRRPVTLIGAHPVEGDVATAAALAVLKASNRVIEHTLGDASAA